MSKTQYPMPQNIPPLPEVAIDWLDFYNADADKVWKVNLNWVLSNWECMFADGCAGCVSQEDDTTFPAIGCCTTGVHFDSREDFEKMQNSVAQLTEDDMDKDQLDWITKNGWHIEFKNTEEEFRGKTKVKNKGCVFARRGQGPDGKTGCALHHLGQRTGQSHIDLMPKTCWQLPIGHREDVTDSLGNVFDVILPWDKDYFESEDGDPVHDSQMLWWCVNTPDAYKGNSQLYKSLREEFIAVMGESSYNQMCELIEERKQNAIAKMPGAVRNEGRPMLPMLIGDRPAAPRKFNK